MSARSPRGSLSGSSDVALDFEDALKDLQQNSRIEIQNLTIIARESTEHAQAISEVLEKHIKRVSSSLNNSIMISATPSISLRDNGGYVLLMRCCRRHHNENFLHYMFLIQ